MFDSMFKVSMIIDFQEYIAFFKYFWAWPYCPTDMAILSEHWCNMANILQKVIYILFESLTS